MVLVPIVSRTLADSNSEAVALDPEDPAFETTISEVINNAASRWLRNDEVLSVLERFLVQQPVSWPNQAASEPPGGSLYIFSRKICRKFRDDKHVWRKKNDNKTVKETHEKLKVGDRERLNCYYAHAESGNGLQRRCYWILDKEKDDVVMVHYLCTSTSRVGGGRSSLVGMQEAPSGISVKSRPQRAAAQRARLGTKVFHDNEDGDFLHGWSGRQSGVTVGSGSVVGLKMESTRGLDQEGASGQKPALDGPMESLLKLPSISGRDNSLDMRLLERNPGLLQISEDQVFALSGVHSPTKSPQKKKGLLPQLSFGIDLGEIFSEKSTNFEDTKLLSPTKSRKKLSSETSEHLLIPGFSRLDSLAEYFPGLEFDGNKDGHFGASGVAFLGKANSGSFNLDKMARSDSYNMSADFSEQPSSSSGQQQNPIKVETIRRITAPGTFEKSHFNFAQHVDGSSSSDSKATHRRRSNPTSVMPKKSMVEKMEAAAIASTDTNTQRREDQLQKARDAREVNEEIDKSKDDHDGGLLIETPNVLFRMQSHLVDGVVKKSDSFAKEKGEKVKDENTNDPGADKAASLFKQMSIDRPQLPDLMLESFENPIVVEEFVEGEGGSINGGGFGSEQDVVSKSVNNNSETESVHGSRDPSLSSLLDGNLPNAFKQSGPGASMTPKAENILKESFEVHRARMKKM